MGDDELLYINKAQEIHPAAHEVWFTFNSDIDAEIFHDWWYSEGYDLLKKHHEDNQHKY